MQTTSRSSPVLSILLRSARSSRHPMLPSVWATQISSDIGGTLVIASSTWTSRLPPKATTTSLRLPREVDIPASSHPGQDLGEAVLTDHLELVADGLRG